MRRRAAGFTLIEIMVVVVIISLLAVFATGVVINRLRAAEIRIAKTQIRDLANKVEMYRMDHRRYPNSLQELVTAPSPYADAEQLIDPWGHPFLYQQRDVGGRKFTIGSYGGDGQPGGTGYDADIWLHELQAGD